MREKNREKRGGFEEVEKQRERGRQEKRGKEKKERERRDLLALLAKKLCEAIGTDFLKPLVYEAYCCPRARKASAATRRTITTKKNLDALPPPLVPLTTNSHFSLLLS